MIVVPRDFEEETVGIPKLKRYLGLSIQQEYGHAGLAQVWPDTTLTIYGLPLPSSVKRVLRVLSLLLDGNPLDSRPTVSQPSKASLGTLCLRLRVP